MKKKWIIALVLIVVLVGGVTFGVIYSKKINSDVAESVVNVSVNPEVQFVLNGANRVIEINYINEDAEIALATSEILGKEVNKAVDIFINASIEAGYINVETMGTKVEIFVQNKNSEAVEKLQNKLITTVNNIFDENGIIAGAVAKAKDDLLNKAQEFGVSIEKYSLMLQASVLDSTLTMLELAELTEEELLELIKNSVANFKDIAYSLKNSLNESLQSLKIRFEKLFDLDEEIEYLKKSVNNSNISEESKKAINAQIDRYYEEYKALKAQFDEEYNAIIDQFKEDSNALLLKSKEKFNELKQLNKQKTEQHLQNYKNNKQEIKQKIQEYRNSLNVA